ncbi:MAG: MmgE/PrpD family protein [Oscillospiraceae bacterium]|nr:MmgE/PrpD family protein [Oscillospiraceae bacterium]
MGDKNADAGILFAEQFNSVKYEDLPGEVTAAAKQQILDYFGVALAGAMKDGAKEVRELAIETGGVPQSTIIGAGAKVPAPNAAQANATMTHSLDFDDVHEAAIMHPGVISISSALAAGEPAGGLSGKKFITAVALGADMICRMGLATRPGENVHKYGWHLTTLNGYITSAAVASFVMGMNVERTVNAMGIAYHQSSGNGQAVKDGAHTKRLGPGFSVRGGIYAAMLAERGVTGARNNLEGIQGLYNVYHAGSYSHDLLVGELGKRYETVNVSIKPYPCCRGVHPCIDCALSVVREHKVNADNVKSITIEVGKGPMGLLGEPLEHKANPRNVVDSQFSLAWGVATAIAKGRAALKDFTEEAIKDTVTLGVAAKVKLNYDPSLDGTGLEPARVIVETVDGAVYTAFAEMATGSPDRPLSFDDCERKFRDCLLSMEGVSLKSAQADELVSSIRDLEKLDDAVKLLKLTLWDKN